MPTKTQAASNWLEEFSLKLFFAAELLTQPTQLEIALFTGDPGEDGVGSNEINHDSNDPGYNRVLLSDLANDVTVQADGNGDWEAIFANTLSFNASGGNWANAPTYFGVYDPDNMNWMYFGEIDDNGNPFTAPTDGETLEITSGQAKIVAKGDATDYFEENVLKYFFGGGTVNQPANLEVALFSADPGDAPDGSTELNYNSDDPGYARVAFSDLANDVTVQADGNGDFEAIFNSTLTFQANGGNHTNAATHFGVYDSDNLYWLTVGTVDDGGNPLSALVNGKKLQFKSGNLAISAS